MENVETGSSATTFTGLGVSSGKRARLSRKSGRWNDSATLGRDSSSRAAIHAAIAEAETGAFVSQTAMDTWISSWDTDSELPPPEPDTFTDSKIRRPAVRPR